MTAPDPALRRRNRTLLLLIAVLFFGSFVVAGLLRFSGWRPAHMKNEGELLQPYGDLRAIIPKLESGAEYAWDPKARLWRILVAPPAACAAQCEQLAAQLDTVWQLFGREADRVHLLWVGMAPERARRTPATRVLRDDAALRAQLPRLQEQAGVPIYVVDPNGFVILRYAPGSDLGKLRTDVARLLKLR